MYSDKEMPTPMNIHILSEEWAYDTSVKIAKH